MIRRPSGTALLLLFPLIFAAVSAARETGRITLTAANRNLKEINGKYIVPADAGKVNAAVSLAAGEKTRAVFKWLAPGGTVISETSKLAFPSRAALQEASDSIVLGASPPEGEWSAEVSLPDGNLSQKFLLTKNRLILGVVYGTKEEKLRLLGGLGPKDDGFEAIAALALADPDEEVRESAAEAFGRAGVKGGMGLLSKAQGDASARVRAAAFLALYGAGERAAADKAVADPSPEVRTAAARIVAASDKAGAETMGRLISDKEPGVRHAALHALAVQDYPSLPGVLARGLTVEDAVFRREVLRTLTGKKGSGRTEALTAALQDPDPEIRGMAVQAAGGDADVPSGAFHPLLGDPDEKVAVAALLTLKRRGDIEGLALGVKSVHGPVKLGSVEALGAAHGGAGAEGLAAAIEDPDAAVRKAALIGLKRAGRAGAGAVARMLRDDEVSIRHQAISALLELKAGEALPEVVKAATDSDPAVREKALQFIILYAGDALPGYLEGFACEPDPSVRSAALSRLSVLKDEKSSKALLKFLGCGNADERESIVVVLSNRKDGYALSGMKSSLKDEEVKIRLQAASYFLGAGNFAEAAALWADPEPAVRKAALAAMSASPDGGMLPALESLAKDPDPDVRLLVLEVLRQVPGERSGAAVAALALEDKDDRVRGRAVGILFSRRDAGVVPAFVALAEGDDLTLRKRAVEELADIPGGEADEAIYRSFRDGGPDERTRAIEILAGRGSALLGEAELMALDDPDAMVRAAALRFAPRLPEDVRENFYLKATASGEEDIRMAGLEALKAGRGERAAAAMKALLADPVSDIRGTAFAALVKGGEPVGGYLPGLIGDPDPEIRRMAFREARGLAGREKADALLAAADGPHPDLAALAVDELVPLGDGRALPVFERYFLDGHRPEEMARGIAAVPGPGSIKYLKSIIENSGSRSIKKFALESLKGRGGDVLNVYVGALEDPDPDIRLFAVSSIAATDAPGRTEALKSALGNDDATVRGKALDTLAKTEGPDALEAVFTALEDKAIAGDAEKALEAKGPGIRGYIFENAPRLKRGGARAAAVALLDAKGLDTVSLASFVDDPAPEARASAALALSGRDGAEAAHGLMLLAADSDAAVKDIAVKGLAALPPEDAKGGLEILFGRGRAAPRILGAVSDAVREPGVILKAVDLAGPRDIEILKGVLGPVIRRGDPSSAPALAAALAARDEGVKKEAAYALAGLAGKEAEEVLLAAYKNHLGLRKNLLAAAASKGRPGALLPVALRDEDLGIRLDAASLLIGYGGKDAEALALMALDDADERVRLAALEAAVVGGFDAPVGMAAMDESPPVRKAAATAIGERGGDNLGRLLLLSLDPDDGVSATAFSYLRELGGAVTAKSWAELAAKAQNKEIRLESIEAMAALREPSFAPVFAALLKDKADAETEEAALRGLQNLGQAALPDVYPLMGDARARLAALEFIEKFGDAGSVGPVINALPEADGRELSAAFRILGQSGGAEAAEAVAGVYNKSGPEIKKSAMKTLSRMDGPVGDATKGAMVDALTGGDEETRYYAALVSARVEQSENLKAALAARMDAEPYGRVKEAIARAIGLGAWYAASRDLGDNDQGVRLAALARLARVGDVRAARDIFRAFGDIYLRDDAMSALRKRDDPETISVVASGVDAVPDPGGREKLLALLAEKGYGSESFIKYIDDPAPEVRRAAAKALLARRDAEAYYGILLMGVSPDYVLRDAAAGAVAAGDTAGLSGGLNLLFDRRPAPEVVQAAAGNIKGASALRELAALAVKGGPDMSGPVVRILIERRGVECVPALLESLKAGETAREINGEVIAAIARSGSPETGAALKEAFTGYPGLRVLTVKEAHASGLLKDILPLAARDGDEAVRIAAAEAAEDAEILSALSGDASKAVRKAAAARLGGISGGDVHALLKGLALDPDPGVSAEAVYSLLRHGEEVPAEIWMAILKASPAGLVKISCMKALEGRKDPAIPAAYAARLGDPDGDVADEAGRLLLAMGPEANHALHPLVADARHRKRALELLKDTADSSTGSHVLAALPAMGEDELVLAALVLGRSGGPESAAALAGLYKTGGVPVRKAAMKGLSMMDKASAAADVHDAVADGLASPSDYIRFNAARAAGNLRLEGLEAVIGERLKAERSALVRGELSKALGTLSKKAD